MFKCTKPNGTFYMYEGNYERENITLREELDRKRIEKEKVEIILYKANYEFTDLDKKTISREARAVKYVYDDGQILHGLYSLSLNGEPNNLEDFNSTAMLDWVFWCTETNIWSEASSVGNVPCEVFVNGKCVNDKALKEWVQKKKNWRVLCESERDMENKNQSSQHKKIKIQNISNDSNGNKP